VNLTSNDNLKRFYELSDDSEASDEEEAKISVTPEATTIPEATASKQSEDLTNESSDFSSSDDDDDNSDTSDPSDIDEKESTLDEIPWHEFDKDTERSEKISNRLAVCNMDWDRIKAMDIFVLLNSFKPSNGVIKSVRVYLSDYGKERIAYENLYGPKELTTSSVNTEALKYEQKAMPENDDNEDDGDNLDRTKLRVYQFNRLKYFYGVVECDTADTANKIYLECDGMEYESSCTRLDLRFIDDNEVFEEIEATDYCLEAPDPLTFKPNLFFTTALNQTKVECTWDETPRDRLAITMRKYREEDLKNTNDLMKILAESESEGETSDMNNEEGHSSDCEKNGDDEDEKKMSLYRDLLFGVEEKRNKERESGMVFDWGNGAEDSADSDNDQDNLVNVKKSKRLIIFLFFILFNKTEDKNDGF